MIEEIVMRKHSLTICLFLALFIPSISFAANHHVRSDCAYNGNGTTWACATVSGGTGAYKVLPATLVRGATYYIADGSYPSYTVDDAVSGTSVITIKKATTSAHGTENGWDSSYGNGQAVFTSSGGMGGIFNIITSYVVFDGVVGSGSNPDSYGFKIATPTNCNQDNRMLGIPPVGYSTLNVSNITVSHVAMTNCGSSYNYGQVGIYSNPATSSNITVSNSYLAGNTTNILFVHWTNSEISGNYFAGNWSNALYHGAQISPSGTASIPCASSDITVKNNIFLNSTGTAVMSVHRKDNYRFKIFNNIIIGGNPSRGFGSGDSAVADVVRQFEVHHNTFINVNFPFSLGALFVGNLSDVNTDKSYAYNNLFYNTINPRLDNYGYTNGAIVHTYNAHYNSTGVYDSSEGGMAVNTTGDPFVNSAEGNYHLKIRTKTGKVLLAPYNIDKDGNTRGASVPGIWDIRDRGVYRYSPGYSPGPNSPAGYSPGPSAPAGDSPGPSAPPAGSKDRRVIKIKQTL